MLCSWLVLAEEDATEVDDVATGNELFFNGYSEALPYTLHKERRRKIKCMRCHATMDSNATPRKLPDAPHTDTMDHGAGKLWCMACHDPDDRNKLHTMVGQQVDFDRAYIVCGACHSGQQKDWYFGAHGKRKGNWQGERVIYNCTHCHDPHEPALEARQPEPPPPVRAGLQRPDKSSHEDKGDSKLKLFGLSSRGDADE